MSQLIHGSAVLVGTIGILIRGPSGSGKSALAAALIEAGARLIADDQVFVSARAGRLLATCPGSIRGQIELRGLGIAHLAIEPAAVVGLVGDFARPDDAAAGNPRLPAPGDLKTVISGVPLPRITLPADLNAAADLIRNALSSTVAKC